MLATMQVRNSPIVDNHTIRIPWFNSLSSQTIPEETDGSDYSKRDHTDSGCSSSSSSSSSSCLSEDDDDEEEDSYVVLEVQRPRPIIIEQNLQLANVEQVKFDEIVQPLVIETPLKRNAMECLVEPLIMSDEQITVLELPSLIKQHRKFMITVDSLVEESTLPEREQTRLCIRSVAFDSTCTINDQNIDNSHRYSFHPTNRSSFLRHVRKGYQTVQSAYYPLTDEPSLIQMKYFDGRPTLIDWNALEISHRTSSSSISSSYRRRVFHRLENFFRFSPFGFIQHRRNKRVTD